MKIKIDSCISTGKEFYATIYPESKKESDYLVEMIEIGESEDIENLFVQESKTERRSKKNE